MNCAERAAKHLNGETVVASELFQRRSTTAAIGDEGGLPSGADPEREAPGFPSNTILTVTDAQAAFECSKRNDDFRATCHAIAAGATELTHNLPRPRSLDPDFTDWDPDDIDRWDERIVLVARRPRLPRLAA
jgi:hypothetical protein